ncbi:hypothetical protein ACFW04_005428 [Cataglyphis niger]
MRRRCCLSRNPHNPYNPLNLRHLIICTRLVPLATRDERSEHAPVADKKRPDSPLSVLEVEYLKQCVLAHFMTPLEPLDPLTESPVSRPLVLQRDIATELVAELALSVSQSILLTNMEKNDPMDFYNEVQCAALRKFDPRDLRYAANHTSDLFNEVATIARPPLPPGGRPPIPSAISIFYLTSIDFQSFRNLRRITLHKSTSQGDKMYLLNLSTAAILLPALRARLYGHIRL